MTEPLGRYDVTVTVGWDGSDLPDPAVFTAAAGQTAWSRSASIISAHLASRIWCWSAASAAVGLRPGC